jgi:hypothetical protein
MVGIYHGTSMKISPRFFHVVCLTLAHEKDKSLVEIEKLDGITRGLNMATLIKPPKGMEFRFCTSSPSENGSQFYRGLTPQPQLRCLKQK